MRIKILCDYEWKKVERKPNEPYKFPEDITIHMKDNYSVPAIYRWVIDNQYYVGETVDLCKRIENYLYAPKPKYNEAGKMLPHQQTTNIKVNACLCAATNNCIGFLEFNELQFGDVTCKTIDLNNKNIRLMVEKIAIFDHVANHQKLLNRYRFLSQHLDTSFGDKGHYIQHGFEST